MWSMLNLIDNENTHDYQTNQLYQTGFGCILF